MKSVWNQERRGLVSFAGSSSSPDAKTQGCATISARSSCGGAGPHETLPANQRQARFCAWPCHWSREVVARMWVGLYVCSKILIEFHQSLILLSFRKTWFKSLETTNSGIKNILFLKRMFYFKTLNFKNDEYHMSVMSIIFMTLQDLPWVSF